MLKQKLAVPETVAVAPDREVWAARIPHLLNGVPDLEKYAVDTLETGYLDVAQALAGSAPTGSALQVRLLSTGLRPHGEIGEISAWIVGAARSIEDALVLWDLVATAFPAELAVHPANQAQCRRVLTWTENAPRNGVADIRRSIADGAPLRGRVTLPPLEPTVLLWEPHPDGLAAVFPVLIRQLGRSALILHMEPTAPSEELLAELSRAHASYEEASRTDQDSREWLHHLSSIARKRLLVLPRGALSVRVALASTRPLRPGLVEAIGLSLCGLGGFESVHPQTHAEAACAEMLVGRAEAVSWGEHSDPVIAELQRIAMPSEAASVVRLPSSPQSGLPGIPCTPMMTLPRSPQGAAGERQASVRIGTSPHGGRVSLTLSELNQHTLVVGLPGFGKTNTVQEILQRLWTDHRVPFLVLDPAKSDYASLIDELGGVDGRSAQRVVLGPDAVAFNPFVVPPGCTVPAHAARVLGAFDAALQISARWPVGYTILSRGLFRAYEEAGSAKSPTLRSLYAAVGDLIRSTPMDPGTRADVNASLLGRLESLVRGPLGAALLGGPRSGIDWEELLARPTVVEFGGFAGPTERSLIFGLLIAGLASVRESRHNAAMGLQHVTVLEEAHRVLQDRGTVESEGVRLLAEAIAELRGSGEGFMVVDQTPSVLHPVVRKVCGSLICHRLIDAEDRKGTGAMLLLDARQTEDLARLPVGQAVVYGALRDTSAVVDVRRSERGGASTKATRSLTSTPAQAHLFCVGCTTMCVYREVGRASAAAALEAGRSSADVLDPEMLRRIGAGPLWCATAHLAARELSDAPPATLLSRLHDLRRKLVVLATASSGSQ